MSQELEKAMEIVKSEMGPAAINTAKKLIMEVVIPYLDEQAAKSETKVDDFALVFVKKAVADALEQVKI